MPSSCVQITEFHDTKDIVALIKAKDNDDPNTDNGKIKFEISSEYDVNLFYLKQIDPWSANILASQPLNNFYGNYTVYVTARDLGTPANVVLEKLEICVTDYNDHAPIFISPANNLTIRIPEVMYSS